MARQNEAASGGHIIAVVCQVLENIEDPKEISSAITEKNSFLDVLHNSANYLADAETEISI